MKLFIYLRAKIPSINHSLFSRKNFPLRGKLRLRHIRIFFRFQVGVFCQPERKAHFISLLSIAFACIITMLVSNSTAFASSGMVFSGEYGDPIWHGENVAVYSNGIDVIEDLFGLATKELAPGDNRTLDIRLENRSGEPYDFYLAATALTGNDTREMEGFFTDKRAEDSLLDAIDIIISYRGGNAGSSDRMVYTGKLGGDADSDMYGVSGVFLGSLAANTAGNVRVGITIPAYLDNSYMDTLCAINWVFVATQSLGSDDDYIYDGDDYPTSDIPSSGEENTGGQPSGIITPDYIQGTDTNISDEVIDIGLSTDSPPLAELEILQLPEHGQEDEDGLIAVDDTMPPFGSLDEVGVIVVVDPGLLLPQTGEAIKTYTIPVLFALGFLLTALAVINIKGKKKS